MKTVPLNIEWIECAFAQTLFFIHTLNELTYENNRTEEKNYDEKPNITNGTNEKYILDYDNYTNESIL